MNKLSVLSLALALTLLTLVLPGLGFQWNDPPPSADSLAVEARRKLAMLSENDSAERRTRRVRSRPWRSHSRQRYIVIDTHTNRLYFRTPDSVLFSALCSTGTGAKLIDTGDGRFWRFDTPKGLFHVNSRLTNPWWRKPDWAFIEEGEPLPENDNERFDPEALGDYAIGFGNGYFIHGTSYERLIGVSVTHGCVRLRSEDLKRLYKSVPIGTPVIIF